MSSNEPPWGGQPSYRDTFHGRVYPGGSVPGGRGRRNALGLMWSGTYTGPNKALQGERATIRRGRRGCVGAQFNKVSTGLGYGWHQIPRCHWRFDKPVPWHRIG